MWKPPKQCLTIIRWLGFSIITNLIAHCSYLLQVQREEWPLLDIKLPVICADGTPFIQERIEKACTLEAFREKYDLDTDVHNVLVESSRFSESDLESAQIFDVIIEDLVSYLLHPCILGNE